MKLENWWNILPMLVLLGGASGFIELIKSDSSLDKYNTKLMSKGYDL